MYVSIILYIVFYHVSKRGKSQNNKFERYANLYNHRINHANRSVTFFHFKNIYAKKLKNIFFDTHFMF